MKKRQYLYAISYFFTKEDGTQGNGCSQIYRPTKINTLSAFNSIIDYLKKENNFSNCVIINIMLLGKVKI